MKSLKFVFVILALAIGIGAPIANAQDAKRQTQAQKDKVAYNLTDEQFKKIDAIYKDAAKQKKAITADTAEKKAQETAITNAAKAKIREVLTSEQQAKWDAANKKPAKGADKPKGSDTGKKDSKKKKSED